ncbi:hypothetical protein ES702_01806 [subsurface metagenome]
MSSYRKGVKAEREIIIFFNDKHSCVCIRSSGSHTPIDVICGNGSEVYAIQVKTGKRRVRVDEEKLEEYARMLKAIPVIARKIPYKGWDINYLTEKGVERR